MNRQFLDGTALAIASAAVAAGVTTVTGSTIDTQGYEDVAILASLGTITATGVPTLKAAQGDASDGSDKADIAGSHVTGDDTMGGKFLVIQIHRPKNRYITPILLRATANIVVNEILVLLRNPSHVPATQTVVGGSVALNTPDAGTA